MDNTMLRLEIAIKRLEDITNQQTELHKFTYEVLKLLNKRLTRMEGLDSQTAEYLTKNNGQTDSEGRDTSVTNPTFSVSSDDLKEQPQEIYQDIYQLIEALQQSQASNGGNKSSQEEEEEPKSNGSFRKF